MRKRLFKAIYDLILVTIKPLRLLQNSPAARYCGGFGAVWPAIRALFCAMSVEGGVISMKSSAVQNSKEATLKSLACGQAEEQRQGVFSHNAAKFERFLRRLV
jgi:hypothetical protein